MTIRKFRRQRAPYELGANQKVYLRVRIPSEPIDMPGALLAQGEAGSNTKCAFASGVNALRIARASRYLPQVTARTMLLPTKDDPKTGLPIEGLLYEHSYVDLTDRNDAGTLAAYLRSNPKACEKTYRFRVPQMKNTKKHKAGAGLPRAKFAAPRGTVQSPTAKGISLRGLRLRMKKAGKAVISDVLSELAK